MSGLFHTLGIGSESLFATRQGVDTTSHNIANAQTEGYSRQRVELSQREPSQRGNILIGNGVFTGTIKRSHDEFLEKQINTTNSDLGQGESREASMVNLEAIFSPELANSVAEEMSIFFDSLQSLSSFPEEVTVRTLVRENGLNLASSFRHVDDELVKYRANVNDEVRSVTGQLGDIVKSIAVLNKKIREAEVVPGAEANDLRDQRDTFVRELSSMIDIDYYQDQFGMFTIRGPGQVLLVDRGYSAEFSVQARDENFGLYDVVVTDFEGGVAHNITPRIESGRLGSLVDVRDNLIGSYLDEINELAYTFVTRLNDVHRQGFGQKQFREVNGRDFFKSIEDKSIAARSVQVDSSIINSIDAIAAASSPSSPGDNVNVNQMLALKHDRLLDDASSTFVEFYANFAGKIGADTVRAKHLHEASRILMTDLQKRSEAISGVSLDEEAANLLRWQTAFTASSKVITTVDEMLDTVLSLKR